MSPSTEKEGRIRPLLELVRAADRDRYLAALYLWGGEVISSFTIAMIFGILVGTYSSIFVAGPLLILFRLRSDVFSAGGDGKTGQVPATAQPSKT